ncbi:MAG: NmrA family NAD(P)-binding protein, partial [Chloroflexi bacterium]|nr:NmrA family NAD(P)-binding protein [Chloroflexota bacterium]
MILVVGATGTIGKYVVTGLKAKGEQVRAMIHNPEKALSREPGVEYVTGDLEKPESVIAALQGVEKAFLLSPEDPRMAELHGKFAAAAKDAGLRHLVRLSI